MTEQATTLYIYAEQEGGLRRTASKYPDCRVLLGMGGSRMGGNLRRSRPTDTGLRRRNRFFKTSAGTTATRGYPRRADKA